MKTSQLLWWQRRCLYVFFLVLLGETWKAVTASSQTKPLEGLLERGQSLFQVDDWEPVDKIK